MKTLFIDFDGTICHDRFWRSLPDSEYHQVQKLLFNNDHRLVDKWMTGKVTAEEVNHFLSNKIGLNYEYLWEIFIKDCKSMFVDPILLNSISNLRDYFHIVLITGNMDSFTRFTVPALNLSNYFDVIVNSFYEGCLKTDQGGSIFFKYLKGSICDSYLIDDSHKVCAVFKEIGGNALCVNETYSTTYHLDSLERSK